VVILRREDRVQEKAPAVKKTPVVKPVVVLQRDHRVQDKVPFRPGFSAMAKCFVPKDDKVWAAWAHRQALSASLNKNANKIPSVIFTNQYIVPDDAVSCLYDNADIDDEDALPPATIAVLEFFFDGLESDDDESSWSSWSSSASEQDDFYCKTLPADDVPLYVHMLAV
jgi:hypothetical protein